MAKNSILISVLSIGFTALAIQAIGFNHEHHHHIREMMTNFVVKHGLDEGILEYITLNLLPSALGFQPANINGSYSEYKDFLLADQSNDGIALATTQEIIQGAGFQQETYDVVSDDGYITQLVRVMNPLADRQKLHPYPVMIFHGGLIDNTYYVSPSAAQSHPEKWPRVPGENTTSSGRSLAFILANNGFDVWLVGTRGSNKQNSRRTAEHLPKGEFPSTEYWSFKMDDISQKEVPRQIEKILQVTKKERLDIFSYSLSTLITMQTFAGNPNIPRNKVNTYIQMAPPLNIDGSSKFTKFLVRDLCVKTSLKFGIETFSKDLTTRGVQKVIKFLLKNKRIRYSVGKLLTMLVVGSSGQYRTNLEPAIYSNLFAGTGFGEMKQWCQQAVARRLQAFDYSSREENIKHYGTPAPRPYDISQDFGLKGYYVISAGSDNLAPISSVNQVMDTFYRRPDEQIFIPNYNHLDLLAGVDNEELINKPLVEILSKGQE